MPRLIDADALIKKIQHDVAMDTNAIQYFGVTPEKEKALKEKIAVEQKCMKYINQAALIATKQVKYYDEDESVWKIGSVIVDE